MGKQDSVRLITVLYLLLCFLQPLLAIQHNQNSHWKLSYDYCENEMTIDIAIQDNNGKEDFLDSMDLYFVDPSGNEVKLLRFREGDGPNVGKGKWVNLSAMINDKNYGRNYHYTIFYAIPRTNISFYEDPNDSKLKWIRLIWNTIPASLSGSAVEMRMRGYFRVRGDNSSGGSFNWLNDNTVLTRPQSPTLTGASTDECGLINLSWLAVRTQACSQAFTETIVIYRSDGTSVEVPYQERGSYTDQVGTNRVIEYEIEYVLKKGGAVKQRSPRSNKMTGNSKAPPDLPREIMVSRNICGGTINLSWINEGLYERIELEWSTDLDFPAASTTTETLAGTDLSWTHDGVQTNQVHFYRFTVIDKCGSEKSSGIYNGISPEEPGTFDFFYTQEYRGNITLIWNNTSDFDHYKIVYNSAEGEVAIDNIPKNESLYTIQSLTPCIDYEFQVFAVNSCSETGSDVVTQSITSGLGTVFDNTQVFASTGNYTDRVEINWGYPGDPPVLDKVKIYRRPLGGTESQRLLVTLDPAAKQYIDREATGGVLYEYTITAETNCNGQTVTTTTANSPKTIGYRVPAAVISGHVAYETGTAVEGVEIIVEQTSGDRGWALNFRRRDGTRRVEIQNSDRLNPNRELTLEMWVSPRSLNGNFYLLDNTSNGNGYGLRYNSGTSQLQFFIQSNNQENLVSLEGLTTNNFQQITAVAAGDSLRLYIHQEDTTYYAAAWSGGAIPRNPQSLWLGASADQQFYDGLMDEVRIWSRAKSPLEVERDHGRSMNNEADGLEAYWRMDEGEISGWIYDVAMTGTRLHRHHGRLENVKWNRTIPAPDQLAAKGFTDSQGNYLIENIRYSNNGNSVKVVPRLYTGSEPHQFSPGSRVLFIGEGSTIINNIDFTDISAFTVTGTVFYRGTNCPAKGVLLMIDGKLAERNNRPVAVSDSGTFELSVPIGEHSISVSKFGHGFENGGQWPSNGSLHNFQDRVSGITFYDTTLVAVVGRAVGGTREADKKPGLGKSKNNIGVAEVIFESENNCYSDTIRTDRETGEYLVYLPPLKYKGPQLKILSDPLIDFGTQEGMDLTIIRPLQTVYDTTLLGGPGSPIGDVDSARFNLRRDFVYRSSTALDVSGPDGGPVLGDSLLFYVEPRTEESFDIPLRPNPFDYPVFSSGTRYQARITVSEKYINKDAGPENPSLWVTDSVPVTDGRIKVFNGLGNAQGSQNKMEEWIDLSRTNGDTLYTFIGGVPEINADADPSIRFTKTFEVDAFTPGGNPKWTVGENGELFRGYVVGARPVDGQSFITEGPEIVEKILRDPPGNTSTASITKGSTHEETYSWSANLGGSFQVTTNIKAGTAFLVGGGLAGIGFDNKVKNDQNNKFTVTTSIGLGGNYVRSTTYNQTISTNGGSELVGAPSDLFMGKSYNYLFGIANNFELVPAAVCGENTGVACIGPEISNPDPDGSPLRLGVRKGMFMVPQGFKTTFIYTQDFIENKLIKNLEKLRNDLLVDNGQYQSMLGVDHPLFGSNNDNQELEEYGLSPSPNDNKTTIEDYMGPSYTFTRDENIPDKKVQVDSVRWYNQQIRLWRNALAKNEKEKARADTKRNISFDGGSSYSYSESTSSSDTQSETFELGMSNEMKLAAGAAFGGSGFVFGFTLTITENQGTSFSQTRSDSKSYSYTLGDNNIGDFFSVDVKDSPNGNGPIFALQGGESMCPWEREVVSKYHSPGMALSESTIRREEPEIDVVPGTVANVPRSRPAKFTLKLGNNSPTGDTQWYGLKVRSQQGSVSRITANGRDVSRVFAIPEGEIVDQELLVYRGTTDTVRLVMELYSTCEASAVTNGGQIFAFDTIPLTAYFIPTCSEVEIVEPKDNWIVNVANGDSLGIIMSEYDRNLPELERIQIEYKSTAETNWTVLQRYWKDVNAATNDPDPQPIPEQIPYTQHLWNLSSVPDGLYEIRAVSHCSGGAADYVSLPVTGIIDQTRPHAFGSPQPADGVLDPNDEISIRFNEEVDPSRLNAANFDIRGVLNGSEKRHNTSASFDGVDDFMETPPGISFGQGSFTIEFWARRQAPGAAILFSKGDSLSNSLLIGFDDNNRLFARVGPTMLNTSTVVTDDNWHHYALVVDRGADAAYLYLDTDLLLDEQVKTLPEGPEPVFIGVYGMQDAPPGGYFQGNIHELRLWRAVRGSGTLFEEQLKKLSGNEIGLTALWPLNEGSGTLVPDIVRKKNAAFNGSWTILPSGKSITFDGSPVDYALKGNQIIYTRQHDFTIEFWMKAGKSGRQMTLLSNGKGDQTDGVSSDWSIELSPGGQLEIRQNGIVFPAIGEDILDDTWHHIAVVTRRRANINVYLDGQLQDSRRTEAFDEFSGPKIWIGSRGWFDGVVEKRDQYYEGQLDDLRFWNKARTRVQIDRDKNNALNGDELGLSAYLPFEEFKLDGGVNTGSTTGTLNDLGPFAYDLAGNNAVPQLSDEDPGIRLPRQEKAVDFTYAINEDKIILTPTIPEADLDNVILDVTVKELYDMRSNQMASPITWTAFVDRNPLRWLENTLAFDLEVGEPLIFEVDIENSGGLELGFDIQGLPTWLTAFPASGFILPRSQKTITFRVSPSLSIGSYSVDANLVVDGLDLNDKLIINLNVNAQPPDWTVDPTQFDFSMSIVGDLDIGGSLSDDERDLVAAFVGEEVRGVGHLQYLPDFDRYEVFLDVYSNQTEDEALTFRAWDASTGIIYGGVTIAVDGGLPLRTLDFQPDRLIGTPAAPARFTVTNEIFQQIPLSEGWNWVSFNVDSEDFDDVNGLLRSLEPADADLIKGVAGFDLYDTQTGWAGTLSDVSFNKLYKIRVSSEDRLNVLGDEVIPADHPRELIAGWNWIGYLPQRRIEINEALNSLQATDGDLIKGQYTFAVYDRLNGWLGSLNVLEPGHGYMLQMAAPGRLTFPNRSINDPEIPIRGTGEEMAARELQALQPGAGRDYASNMTLIARVHNEERFSVSPERIGAFINGELQSIGQPVAMPWLGDDRYFFTITSSEEEPPVEFFLLDDQGQPLRRFVQELSFGTNAAIGTLEQPYVLDFASQASSGNLEAVVYPNPFTDGLTISCYLPVEGQVTAILIDVAGRELEVLENGILPAGLHQWAWDGNSSLGRHLAPGVYFLRIQTEEAIIQKKVIKQ